MKMHISTGFCLILWGMIGILLIGTSSSVTALQFDTNLWVGKTTEISFEHNDHDVASEDNPFELSYQGPFYAHSKEQEFSSSNTSDNPQELKKKGDLSSVEALEDVEQPDAYTSTEVTSLGSGTDQLTFEIDLNVKGNSYYNKTTTGPGHNSEDNNEDAYRVESFTLTTQSLEALKNASIPQDILDILTPLENRTFTGEKCFDGLEVCFLDVVKQQLGQAQYDSIVQYDQDTPVITLILEQLECAYYTTPDYDAVKEGQMKYYNNWEMTSADSHAYGGYGGSGNMFSVADDGDGVIEQFWITAALSYDYDLTGFWSYQHTENENGYEFDERTGYFWTSFATGFSVTQEGSTNPLFAPEEYSDSILRNEITGDKTNVSQERGGDGTLLYSFAVTEGENYIFDFFADLYGYADGIASYNSFGLAELTLNVVPMSPIANPEPGTIFLMGLGIFGILSACRKRFSK